MLSLILGGAVEESFSWKKGISSMKKSRKKDEAKKEVKHPGNDVVIAGALLRMFKDPLTNPRNKDFARRQLVGFNIRLA